MNNDTWTIQNIDTNTGNVTVSFSVDGKSQKLAGVPMDNAESTKAYLDDYARAYRSGLETEAAQKLPQTPQDVQALVGRPQTVDTGSGG